MNKAFGIQFFIVFFMVFGLFSCQYFKKEEQPDILARVGESYIYKRDVENLLPKNYTKEDSVKIVDSYINNWATKELLMLNANRNIPPEKKEEFDKLVEDYKRDLYGRYYKEKILSQSVDTVVSADEQAFFYEQNKNIFKLNEDLIKLRYILLGENQKDQLKEIEGKFKRFDTEDKKELDSLFIYFKSSFFNDSTWVKAGSVYQKLPFLEQQKPKAERYISYEDSTGTYLIKINDYLARTEQAPIEYVTPILKQIILNQRKLENAKKFEKELIQTAIKKKQFEIYE